MQGIGNLVEYAPTGKALFTTGINPTGTFVVMQATGNLVVDATVGKARWASNTNGHTGAYLVLSHTGQLQVVAAAGEPFWAGLRELLVKQVLHLGLSPPARRGSGLQPNRRGAQGLMQPAVCLWSDVCTGSTISPERLSKR
ncbi:MAG: hypothetical protein M0Z95_07610, partial [Actinomycetota bacterium]|nr:hypothetical protein [Actinomycetota bacterium]